MVNVVVVAAGGANMALLNQFERHLQEGRFFSHSDCVIVAVSTGVDSMVLLDLIQRLPATLRPSIIVAHVNHHLRAQSRAEEQFIKKYCQQRQLKLICHHWPRSEHPVWGIEAAARQMRYNFFAQVMEEYHAHIVLTAHHANDLVETMLMKLVRGGQLDQLIGIADQRRFHDGYLVRPLLPFSKQQLLEYANHHHLKWFEDVTNQDLTIQRNRYRHQIIPTLEQENPQLLSAMWNYHQQLTTILATDHQRLDQDLHKIVSSAGHLQLNRLPKAQNQRIALLRRWLEKYYAIVNLKQTELEQISAAIQNPQQAHFVMPLPGQKQLIKNYSELFVQKVNKFSDFQQKANHSVVEFEHWYPVNANQLVALSKSEHFFDHIDCSITEQWLPPQSWPLVLRPWRPGDQLLLKGGGHQLVRRALINAKVPVEDRAQQLVLATADNQILSLVGIKWSWWQRPTNYQNTWQHFYVGQRNLRGEKNE